MQLGIGFVGVALAFGLTVLTGAFAFGHVSGGHFNPAVTVGLAVAGRFGWREVPHYVVTQVVAAIRGRRRPLDHRHRWAHDRGAPAPCHRASPPTATALHSPGGYGLGAALLTEIVMTAAFLYVILGATDDRTNKAFAPDRHRARADPDPPDQHPGHQHLGEPRPLARRRLVRRRRGSRPGLALRPRPVGRCRHRRRDVRPLTGADRGAPSVEIADDDESRRSAPRVGAEPRGSRAVPEPTRVPRYRVGSQTVARIIWWSEGMVPMILPFLSSLATVSHSLTRILVVRM